MSLRSPAGRRSCRTSGHRWLEAGSYRRPHGPTYRAGDGAAQGLGLAISTRLAPGRVRRRDGRRQRGGRARRPPSRRHRRPMDVTDDESVAAAWRCRRPLDVLVNNAGIISRQPAAEFDSAQWDLEMAVNLGGTMRVQPSGVPTPAPGDRARRSSTWPRWARRSGCRSDWATARRRPASSGLTRTLAGEWGRAGIRVNAVAPGYIETPMMLSRLRHRRARPGPAARPNAAGDGSVPAREVAGAVSFLASARTPRS